ncbi:MAG TPA: PfkB family carbohydrate kinase [Streptosporangiaceae bacterium]|nr:PfkB family carbohydrate kinase [Streptosporangiaceae bacterium]
MTVLGACILDVLGRPVETIPPGQGSVRLTEIRATAAGTAAGGCLLATQPGRARERLPALAVEVVDTTGCGDGFTAGMLAGLLLGAAPADAAWLGVACGSLVATGLGSDAGIEGLDQVLDFLSHTQPAVAGRIKERMG